MKPYLKERRISTYAILRENSFFECTDSQKHVYKFLDPDLNSGVRNQAKAVLYVKKADVKSKFIILSHNFFRNPWNSQQMSDMRIRKQTKYVRQDPDKSGKSPHSAGFSHKLTRAFVKSRVCTTEQLLPMTIYYP